MARGREQHIEHLLRSAASARRGRRDPLRRDALRLGRRPPAQLRTFSGRRRRQDRPAGLRRRDRPRRRRLPAADEHRRRAAAVAVPDGAQPAPAAGEDGALLAQPLRHRLLEDQRRVRRSGSHADDRGQAHRRSERASSDRSSCSGSTRSATSAICSSTSRRIRRCWCGSTAGRTCAAGRRRTSRAS